MALSCRIFILDVRQMKEIATENILKRKKRTKQITIRWKITALKIRQKTTLVRAAIAKAQETIDTNPQPMVAVKRSLGTGAGPKLEKRLSSILRMWIVLANLMFQDTDRQPTIGKARRSCTVEPENRWPLYPWMVSNSLQPSGRCATWIFIY